MGSVAEESTTNNLEVQLHQQHPREGERGRGLEFFSSQPPSQEQESTSTVDSSTVVASYQDQSMLRISSSDAAPFSLSSAPSTTTLSTTIGSYQDRSMVRVAESISTNASSSTSRGESSTVHILPSADVVVAQEDVQLVIDPSTSSSIQKERT